MTIAYRDLFLYAMNISVLIFAGKNADARPSPANDAQATLNAEANSAIAKSQSQTDVKDNKNKVN